MKDAEYKFKAGDRVAVYDGADRAVGRVSAIFSSANYLLVALDSDQPPRLRGKRWHPKQCRKLVKRERRRVWLMRGQLEQGYGVIAAEYFQPEGNAYAEFVEVCGKAKRRP